MNTLVPTPPWGWEAPSYTGRKGRAGPGVWRAEAATHTWSELLVPGGGHRHGGALPIGFSTPPHSSVQGCSPHRLGVQFPGSLQGEEAGVPSYQRLRGHCEPAAAWSEIQPQPWPWPGPVKRPAERGRPCPGPPAATPVKSAAHPEPQQPAFRKSSAAHSTTLWIKFKSWKSRRILCNIMVSDQTKIICLHFVFTSITFHTLGTESREWRQQRQGQGRGRPDASALPRQACCRPRASPFSRAGKQVSRLAQVLRTKETLLSDDIYKATNQKG